tara:strand:- start:210 stop:404 length:195 start_codon:yes stop_codon:yes gene_type:complete
VHYTITPEELEIMRKKLLEIGSSSLKIINLARKEKGEVWEEAIKVNHTGKKLYQDLGQLFHTDA